MAIGGMYGVQNPMERTMQMYGQAAGTYGSMSKRTETKHEEAAKTVGGGIAAGAGGAAGGAMAAGAMGAKMGSAGGDWGVGIGAVVGLLAYYLG